MDGAIVINRYLDGPSFREPAEMISEAAGRLGLGMKTYLNTDLSVPIGDSDAFHEILGDIDFVVFWDKDVKLAKNLEVCDIPVFNCSECIRICDDKSLTHLTLADYGIPSIRTIASPMSFGRPYDDFAKVVMDTFTFPLISKDCFGSYGKEVRMVRNEEELMKEEQRRKLHQAIGRLKHEQRTAIVLYAFNDFSYNDIADVMQVSLSKVESLIFRAKKNLKKMRT